MLIKYLKMGAALALLVAGIESSKAGLVQQLFYDGVPPINIPGTAVTNLTTHASYPDSPTAVQFIASAATGANQFTTAIGNDSVNNFGSLMRGYIEAPQNGNYKFSIRSDDASELWLSPDLNPANKVRIAQETGCCEGGWDETGEETSTNIITLVRGQKYYFEAIYKDGGGGDYMQVGWNLPNGRIQQPMPIHNVAPYEAIYDGFGGIATNTTPVIGSEPLDTTVVEARDAVIFVNVYGAQPITYRWFRSGTLMPGENLSYVEFTNAQVANSGSSYFVIISNSFGSVTSAVATLTVTGDITAPTVVSALTSGNPNGFVLRLSEPVTEISATNVANYVLNNSVSGPVAFSNLTFSVDRMGVRFYTGLLTGGGITTLTINNVRDLAATPNSIAPNTQAIIISADGTIKRSIYRDPAINDTMGSFTNHIKFINDTPDVVDYPSLPEEPGSDDGGNFGTRLRGYVTAPETGDYTFYISADDNAVLFLSTNEQPATKVRIAFEPTWNNYRDFLNTARRPAAENISAPIALVAGQRYFIEALASEGGGGDNLSVGWKRPSMGVPAVNADVEVIPGGYLSPYQPTYASGPVLITQQPTNTTTGQSTPATFRVVLDGTPPYGFQWYKNNVLIAGANAAIYSTPPVAIGDNGATFNVVVANGFSSVTSSIATLTVQTDFTVPTIVSVGSVDGTEVGICFSELMDPATSGTAGNYTIPGTTVTNAVFRADGLSVVLSLSAPLTGNFTVTVNNARDLAGNPVTPNSSASGSVAGWVFTSIGGPTPVGSAFSCSPGDFDIVGGGSDVWGGSDMFSFVSTPRTNYFDVNVRILRIQFQNSWSKAGVMARETFDANSRTIQTYGTPTNGANQVESGVRRTVGGNTDDYQIIGRPPSGLPNRWVRLRRVGDLFTAFSSTNGVNWVAHGQTTEAGWPATLNVGLFSTSHNNGAVAGSLAEFEDFGNTVLPGASVSITSDLTNKTVFANVTTTFSVGANATPASELVVEWQRGDGSGGFTNIPGAVGINRTNYTTPLLTLADNGSTYRALLYVPGAAAISAVSTLTVLQDIVPLTIVGGAGSRGFTNLTVRFSEPVDPANLGTYTVNGGLTLISATVDATGTNVILETSTQAEGGTNYLVTVSGVRDLSGNLIAPNSPVTIQSFAFIQGYVLVRRYDGITGGGTNALNDFLRTAPNFPNNPTITHYNTVIEKRTPQFDECDNCGFLINGYVLPAVSGLYNFFMSADDIGQLWLSTNNSPANMVQIASEPVWNGSRDYLGTARRAVGAPENRSTTLFPGGIDLVAGQRYYFEALAKEGGGGDNLSVAWQPPGELEPANGSTPLGGTNVGIIYNPDPSLSSISFTQSPTNTTVLQSRQVTFTSVVVGLLDGGTTPVTYQWQRDDGSGGFTNIPGATASSFLIPITVTADNGAIFRVIGSKTLPTTMTATSSLAVLTITADTLPPALVSAYRSCLLSNTVFVVFDESLSAASANTAGNYLIPGTTVTNAVLNGTALLNGARQVVLTTSSDISGGNLTVNGVQDLAGNPLNGGSIAIITDTRFQESGAGGVIVLEAENYDRMISQGGHDWTFGNDRAGYSGLGFMEATPNGVGATVNTGYDVDSPRLDYCVNITTTGTFHVWIRGSARTTGGNSDSLHAGYDELVIASSDRISPGLDTLNWAWTKTTSDGTPALPATFDITTTGQHRVNVWMREDGIIVDKILLTLDANFNPQTVNGGLGPNESTRGAVVIQPRITSIVYAGGNVTIVWTGGGNLQSSANVIGTYVDIQGATTGTHTEATSGAAKYYRVRR